MLMLLVRSQSCSFEQDRRSERERKKDKHWTCKAVLVLLFLNGKVLNSLVLASTICTAMALPELCRFFSHSHSSLSIAQIPESIEDSAL